MKRFIFLITLFLVYSVTAHGSAHHHEGAVEVSLDENSKLSVLFHDEENEDFDAVNFNVENGQYVGNQTVAVDHNGHEDWSYVFTVSDLSVCDDVHVVVTGNPGNNQQEEFRGSLEIPDPTGNCN